MSVTPKPSATIVLARDADRGPELLFVRRRAGDAFGETYTFPGGVLDVDEFKAREFCIGVTDGDASSMFGIDSGGLDYFSAVVRELFEETGILLTNGELGENRDEARAGLYAGRLGWREFLRRNQLTIACDQMHYFAHWITPTLLPKRWTTRFFLARMPAGQTAVPDGSEITDARWMTASEALDSARERTRRLPYPTRKTVASFGNPETVDDLLNWARLRQVDGVPAIQPEMRRD
jgi:8-oxo-dGTP pyrophosphatase MutT (NUDIX family)